jgi:dTDP-4-dehydrorhamnose reductase
MIWLIGHKGMLGSEVESLLKLQGSPYVATDQELDIADLDQLTAFAKDHPISWIVNCAAYTAVDQAEEDADAAFRTNAIGPLNLAQIAQEKKAKLIHVSTDYVFDGKKKGPYDEMDIPQPLGIYGLSKYEGEQNIAKTLNEYFIIRTAWLYGLHGRNFVYTILRLLKERTDIRVVNDQFGSPTYAPDLAEVILRIMQSDSDCYGIYHFTNEGRTSWHCFACAIAASAKAQGMITSDCRITEIPSEQYPTKAKRPMNSDLSKEKIRNTFHISIRPWEAALKEFLAKIQYVDITLPSA